jgi:hypothetical protein
MHYLPGRLTDDGSWEEILFQLAVGIQDKPPAQIIQYVGFLVIPHSSTGGPGLFDSNIELLQVEYAASPMKYTPSC